MKAGDLVRGYNRWLGRVLPADKKPRKVKGLNLVRLQWETGPLKGREGLVLAEYVKKA